MAFRERSYDDARLPIGKLSLTDAPLKIVHKDGGFVYEVALPWKTLGAATAPVAGSSIGITLAVNSMQDSNQLDPCAIGLFGGADTKQCGSLILGGR